MRETYKVIEFTDARPKRIRNGPVRPCRGVSGNKDVSAGYHAYLLARPL